MRSRAGENAAREGERKCQVPFSEKMAVTKSLYAASVEVYCVALKMAKHPLYGCKVSYGLPNAQIMTIVRANGLCLNCLRPGHFATLCSFAQKCKKCQKSYHSWLHINTQDKETRVPDMASPREDNRGVVTTHMSQSSSSRQVLLITCLVRVTSPDDCSTRATDLSESASSALF